MLVVTCPACGAPARVALERRDTLECAHCEYAGEMPAAARDKLAAAAEEVARSDAHARQLHGLSRRLAVNAGSVSIQYAAIVLVLAGVAAYLTHRWGTDWHRGGARELFLPAVSLVLVLLLGWPGGAAMRRAARSVADASAATPPFRPGEPFGCRVCGAPIASTPPIARCSHCSADNILDPGAIARASARRGTDVADLQLEVSEQLTAIHDRSVSSVAIILPFAALFMPVLVIVFGEHIFESLDKELAEEEWFLAVNSERAFGPYAMEGCIFRHRADAEAKAVLRVEKVPLAWARQEGTYVALRPLFGLFAAQEVRRDGEPPTRYFEPLDGFCTLWNKRPPSRQ